MTILCENCTSNPKPAIAFCVECKANLCKDCLQVIHSNRLFQTHQTTKPFKTVKCAKHNQFCTCLCAKCQELCCQACIEEDHQGHVIQSIEKAFNIILSESQRKNVSLNEFSQHVKDINEKVKEQQYILDTDMKTILQNVQQQFEQLNKVITQKQLEIQSSIEQFEQNSKSSLQVKSNYIQSLQTAIKNSLDYLTPIMAQVDTSNSFVETQQKAGRILEWLQSQNKIVDLDDQNNEFKDVVSRLMVELQSLGRYTVDLSQIDNLADNVKAYELKVDKM